MQAIGEVEEVAFFPVFEAGAFGPVGATAPGHAAETGAVGGVFNGEAEVAVFDDFEGGGEADAERDEEWFRVAVAERAELLEGLEEDGGDLAEGELGIAFEYLGGLAGGGV